MRIVPALFGWQDPGSAFSTAMQLAAAISYFWRDASDLLFGSLENRAASSRLKPRKNAAANVEPERDTQGISAPTCAIPTTRQSRSPTRSIDR
jgi:hypothetical protein